MAREIFILTQRILTQIFIFQHFQNDTNLFSNGTFILMTSLPCSIYPNKRKKRDIACVEQMRFSVSDIENVASYLKVITH